MRKNILYAPRVKGDLDLGFEPSRIDPGGDKRLAEIFAPGGRLPGRPEQDIYELDTTKNYRIGTRRVLEDRVFRYCYAKENLNYREGAFMEKLLYWEGESEGLWGKDATTFEFHNTGVLTNTPILVHALKDGWIVSANQCQRIKDNEAENGSKITSITLYRGLTVGLTDTQTMYVYPNIYANCRNHGGVSAQAVLGTVVAVPLIAVTAEQYFWGLTYGIFYGICGNMCDNVSLHEGIRWFGFDGFGQLIHLDVDKGGTWQHYRYQIGGYVMVDGNGATSGGDQLCMLHLAP